MGIIKEIFGKVRIYQLRSRVDSRGFMSYVFDENIYDFSIKEARIYSMPKEGTFFGIHYKEESSPMTKLVTVIKGKGMDYVIDLRKGSPTYLQWESIELSEENALAVQIPAGNILTIVIRRLGSNFRCLFLKFRIMIRMLLLSFSEPEDL